MPFSRRLNTAQFPTSWAERDALARAEYLCEQAEALHNEAEQEAERILARARMEAARLLREAITVCDENVAKTKAALRQQEFNELIARAAREEAERVLESARRLSGFDPAATGIDLRDIASVHP